MFRYEVLFLTVPEITGDESEAIKSYFMKAVRSAEGEMISFDRWGKYLLAYPVNHNHYGVYFLARFEVGAAGRDALLKAIKDAFVFKFNTIVTKNIVTRLDAKASLEYKRPESLEDNPADVDTFLKNNDMKGLIKKQPRTQKADDIIFDDADEDDSVGLDA